jgi:hypothetical protein
LQQLEDSWVLCQVGALTGPECEQVSSAGLLRRKGEVTHEGTLQWIRQYFGSRPIQSLEQLIVDPPRKSARKAPGQRCVPRPAAENSFAMLRVRSRLLAGEKDCAHLNACGSEREGRNNAASIGDSASSYNRDFNRIYRLRHKRERAGQRIFGRSQEGAAMSACLETRCNHNIDACVFQRDSFISCGRRSDRDDRSSRMALPSENESRRSHL